MTARAALFGAAGKALAVSLAVIGGTLALLTVFLVASGADAGRAFQAFGAGAFGSAEIFASSTLVRATPLILTGLAVALAFRAGILNIGADGQLLAGATASTAFALHFAELPSIVGVPLLLLAGALGGMLAALIPAFLRRRFGVLEVISTIMMNFIVLHFTGWLVRGPLQEPTGVYPQSASIPTAYELARVIPGTRLHLGLLLAVALAVALSVFLRRTAAGFRIRVSGANPRAAASAARLDVPRLGMRVFLASGALAGVAGSVEVAGVTRALYENLSPGYGFTAIAVALLGGLEPLGVLVSGTFFGGLAAGAASMQREAGIPSVVVWIIEAVVILAMVLWRQSTQRSSGPADAWKS